MSETEKFITGTKFNVLGEIVEIFATLPSMKTKSGFKKLESEKKHSDLQEKVQFLIQKYADTSEFGNTKENSAANETMRAVTKAIEAGELTQDEYITFVHSRYLTDEDIEFNDIIKIRQFQLVADLKYCNDQQKSVLLGQPSDEFWQNFTQWKELGEIIDTFRGALVY